MNMRSSNAALAAITALITLAGIAATIVRGTDYLIPSLALLCPINIVWAASRIVDAITQLASRPQREQLALTSLDPADFLKSRLLVLVSRSVVTFAISSLPLVATLAVYTRLGLPANSPGDRLRYFFAFVPMYYAIAALGYVMLLSGLLRVLRSQCRAANQNHVNQIRASAFPTFSILSAAIVPWALGLGFWGLFGSYAPIAPLLVVLVYSLADVADSYKNLCGTYFQFE